MPTRPIHPGDIHGNANNIRRQTPHVQQEIVNAANHHEIDPHTRTRIRHPYEDRYMTHFANAWVQVWKSPTCLGQCC